MTAKLSAGVLLYRLRDDEVEVLLAHPGGPLWSRRDAGAWSIPKGEPDAGEDLRMAAVREFAEETGLDLTGADLIDLGSVVQRAGKVVHAWGCSHDLDPASLESNTFTMEWPPRSGKTAEFPEIDRVEWFPVAEAAGRINPAQAHFLERLRALLTDKAN